ncbi:iron complex outermembrane recepter protein [Pustulibacterium marinum]|uniref:Iron complex outermembrane recepter protein n=1 Tax=Pustulibacterium marinum TaxID=1224947 RepID=A0A1I7IDC2_9FLAO|nr:TonB-dependent receptor [Pustulibacterium marinum]SFU70911.1 iron complex outermembrane recepter protein [Pustulibacterium marinum]
MKQLFVVILFLTTSLIASAQECNQTLSGTITDFHDGSPLFGALIQVIGTDTEVTSDFDGNYIIPQLCNGTVELQISHPECESTIVTFNIDGDTKQNIKLEHHLEEIGEVTVSGVKLNPASVSSNTKELNEDAIQAYSSSNLGTALTSVSGVSSLSTGSSIVKPVIHGMHSSRVLVINNGVRLQDQEWGVEHAPNLDINSASHITVVKGASALKYGGDAIGGVIIVDGSQPIKSDSLYGKTTLTGVSNGQGGSLTSSLTKSFQNGWYVKGQGTYKKFGDYEAPDYILSNTGSTEKDFSLGLGVRKFDYGFNLYYSLYDTQIGILRASHIGSIGDLVDALESNEPTIINDFTYDLIHPYQDVQHHLVKADFYKRFSELGKLSVQYDFQNNQRKEYDIRRGDDRDTPSMDMVLNTHTVNTDFQLDAIQKLKMNFGLSGGYQKNTPNPDTGVRRLIPDYEQINAAAYFTAEHQLTDNTIIDAGIRYDFNHIDAQKYYRKSRWTERGYDEDFEDIIIGDYDTQWLTNPIFDYHNFSATAGIKSVHNNYIFTANASMASRAPNAAELFSDGLHHSAATIELGDLRLQQEISKKISLGVEKQYGDFNFNINPYINFIKDFIVLQPTGIEQTTRGAFPVWEYSQADAFFTGVDADASYNITDRWKLNSSFAYVYAQNSEEKTPIIDIPAANWTNEIKFNIPKWHQLQLGLKAQTVFTQTRYPNNDFEATYTSSEGTVTRTVALSKPPKGYGLLHFNSQITLNTFKRNDLNIGFYVDNILDTSYRNYLNRQRYYADDLGRNFRLQLTLNY